MSAGVAPEQLRQTNTPKLTLAQVGPLELQSAQRRLPSSLSRLVKMRLCSSFWRLLTDDLSFRAIFDTKSNTL